MKTVSLTNLKHKKRLERVLKRNLSQLPNKVAAEKLDHKNSTKNNLKMKVSLLKLETIELHKEVEAEVIEAEVAEEVATEAEVEKEAEVEEVAEVDQDQTLLVPEVDNLLFKDLTPMETQSRMKEEETENTEEDQESMKVKIDKTALVEPEEKERNTAKETTRERTKKKTRKPPKNKFKKKKRLLKKSSMRLLENPLMTIYKPLATPNKKKEEKLKVSKVPKSKLMKP